MKKLLEENPDTPCTLRGTDFAAKDVFDAARAGDALAAKEVDQMTDDLVLALAIIAATADPEVFPGGRRRGPGRRRAVPAPDRALQDLRL